jgi:LacI family transcriptional regulator
LQASQLEWDIFIEEDFRARIENIKEWLGDGVIADYDDPEIESCWPMSTSRSSASAALIISQCYPPVHYIATITPRWSKAPSAFKERKGCTASRFTVCPPPAVNAGP